MNSDEQQPPSSRMFEFLTWLEVNKQRLAYGAVAVLAAICAGYFVNYQRQQKEIQANAALFALRQAPDATGKFPPPDTAALLNVAQSYAGTKAAEHALLEAAGGLFAADKFKDAKEKFDQFAKDYPDSQWASVAALGSAACLDGMNDLDKALAAYQQVAGSFAGEPAAAQAKIAAAVIHEARNQPELALKIYDELLRTKSQSAWQRDAEQRKEMLLAKNPALAEAEKKRQASLAAPIPVSALTTNAETKKP